MSKTVLKRKVTDAITEELYNIIKSPVITEKSTMDSQYNKITFNVSLDASKPLIKEAVEKLFKVKVVKVNTILNKGKTKTFKGQKAFRSDSKKAVVTLAEGESIDITSGV